MNEPFFSIIIPAFNRGRMLRRAVDSALAQEGVEFEVIVVDDASTDDTLAVARSYSDPRITVLARPTNGGPCQARNAGVDASRGRWLVMLDSDDALQPHALRRLRARCELAGPDIGNLISACRRDTGIVTPRPLPPARLDYEGFLRWVDAVELSDYLNCLRREVFSAVRYADSRAWERSFHLGVARRWILEFDAEPLVTVHTDADNRLTTGRGAVARRRMLAEADDKLRDGLATLEEHAPAMARFAPRSLEALKRDVIKNALLAGERRVAWRLLRAEPASFWNVRLVVIAVAGTVHRGLLAWLNARS